MNMLTQTIYFRHEELSPQDQRDLDAYMKQLRDYYDIPADQPVFPPETCPEPGLRQPGHDRPSSSARNDASHPWRADQPRRLS